MEIWLSMENDRLRIPVLPPSFEVEVGNNNTVVNISEIGDINLIGKSGLKTITISSFFPSKNYYFVEYTSFPKPYKTIEKLEKWRCSGKPIRLIITTTDINILMTIENLTYGERDGTGDIYYTLDLQEYKTVKTKKVAQVKIPEPRRPVLPKPKHRTYVVKRGDSLWAIAKKIYGNGNQWRKIYNKNKKVIGSNPNLIYPGQKYIIP